MLLANELRWIQPAIFPSKKSPLGCILEVATSKIIRSLEFEWSIEMQLKAMGYRRCIYNHTLMAGDILVENIGHYSTFGRVSIGMAQDGIVLKQVRNLTMNGDFETTLHLSDNEIASLFAMRFRNKPLVEIVKILSQKDERASEDLA